MHDKSKYLFGDADDKPRETTMPAYGRVFPHSYGLATGKYFATFLPRSPAGDDLTLAFAKALMDGEQSRMPRCSSVPRTTTPACSRWTPQVFPSMLQCFARTADLDKLYPAAGKVIASANVTAMKLVAFKYYYAPGGAVGVAGICAKPTPEILKLQADIITAVKPFTVETGTIAAFTAPHNNAKLDAMLLAYVSTFVPRYSGEIFNPHVSTGTAPTEYLDKMLAEPFEPFTFSPADAAVYEIGPFGTAAKKLKEWDLKR